MIEEWKRIDGFKKDYYVSSLGRIRNSKNQILKPHRWYEYLEIQLCENGKKKHYKVHRLVAEAFIPNPEHKPQINHIDGLTMHNEVSNLEWVTNAENIEHRRRLNELRTQRNKLLQEVGELL